MDRNDDFRGRADVRRGEMTYIFSTHRLRVRKNSRL